MLLTIIIFVVVLSVLVFAHELGHFFSARFFGVKAEEFGFGFPPRAVGLYRNKFGKWKKVFGNIQIEKLENNEDEKNHPASKSTIYSLNWLPIGGFVKIKGENGEGQSNNDSFASKKIWKRIVILAAGVIMNIVLAWFLFSLGYLIGMPQSTAELGKSAKISGENVLVMDVVPGSVAELSGLKAGDAILKIDDTKVALEKDVQDIIGSKKGEEVSLLINRDGASQVLKMTPEIKENGRAQIGISITAAGLVRYSFFPAIWEGARTVVWILEQIVVSFINLFADLFHGQSVGDQFAGPVGIAGITGQAARMGFTYLLQFMAILSLNLAIINILPFPALDGGRILFLLIEKIKGKPVRQELEVAFHNIGFLLLMALVAFITLKDIIKLF